MHGDGMMGYDRKRKACQKHDVAENCRKREENRQHFESFGELLFRVVSAKNMSFEPTANSSANSENVSHSLN